MPLRHPPSSGGASGARGHLSWNRWWAQRWRGRCAPRAPSAARCRLEAPGRPWRAPPGRPSARALLSPCSHPGDRVHLCHCGHRLAHSVLHLLQRPHCQECHPRYERQPRGGGRWGGEGARKDRASLGKRRLRWPFLQSWQPGRSPRVSPSRFPPLPVGMVVCNWVVILSVCITVLCVFDPTGRTFVKLRATKRRQRNLRTYNLRSVGWAGGWSPSRCAARWAQLAPGRPNLSSARVSHGHWPKS